MNENLNLINILKNCPQGTKLYSVIYGEVELEAIVENDDYPIKYSVKTEHNITYKASVSIDGRYHLFHKGECTLFPSKDQRNWSKFNIEPEMIDGEFYYCFYGNRKENSFIFIYKKHTLYKTRCYAAINTRFSLLFRDDLITSNPIQLRKATKEEKQQLLDAIKIRNYEWDADKKVLIKIESKFNINNLQPFDKVLVRDCNTHKWKCDFYDSYMEGNPFPFVTTTNCYKQCIPYNTQTKDLAGKTEMPPEKYINWEE